MFMGTMQTGWIPDTLGLGLGQPSAWIVVVLVGLVLGALIGSIQGFVIGSIGVPSFIVARWAMPRAEMSLARLRTMWSAASPATTSVSAVTILGPGIPAMDVPSLGLCVRWWLPSSWRGAVPRRTTLGRRSDRRLVAYPPHDACAPERARRARPFGGP
jgi:ribose/xylose/arabinose/galactoside ABC-type transport system permease subunit